MTISSHSARYLLGAVTAVAAAALIAGCSGSSSVPPTSGVSNSPMVKGHCAAHGGVRVTPCSVTFTPSNTGPFTVITREPEDKKGTFTESDNCGGASGIATVTAGTGDSWTVTAGATTGSCTATFDYNAGKHGKLLGWGNLSITNSI